MNSDDALRSIPSVDKILAAQECAALLQQHGHQRCTTVIRDVLTQIRTSINSGEFGTSINQDRIEIPGIVSEVGNRLSQADENTLRKVINLTGTVLHTNLGRAQLPKTALEAIVDISEGASNLEFDLDAGIRGDRDSHVSDLIAELTGAEAATIVNNNAAAVMLCLNTLAESKEVCISRGELVEIGGSFRIPEVMEKSGCKLVEVGSTNRTHTRDYEKALSGKTALLLKVHTSNYEIQGFTGEVSYHDVAEIAGKAGVPFLADLGSGTLVELEQYGLKHEPTVQEVLSEGVDVVTFSGDKLLGGPQAGIIAGRADLIERIKANPLKRALRVDKMTMAALTEVLKLYRQPETLAVRNPTLKYLSRTSEEILELAKQVLPDMTNALASSATVTIVETSSQIGSGALPVGQLPSHALEFAPLEQTEAALQTIVSALKNLRTPIIGRLQDGKLLLDIRTLADPEELTSQLGDLQIP